MFGKINRLNDQTMSEQKDFPNVSSFLVDRVSVCINWGEVYVKAPVYVFNSYWCTQATGKDLIMHTNCTHT